MLAQHIYGLALGDEDLNDHQQLRHDPRLALLAQQARARGVAGRMELTPASSSGDGYHKITHSGEALDRLLVNVFLEAQPQPPAQIVLDLDVTDRGKQNGPQRRKTAAPSGTLAPPLSSKSGLHARTARKSLKDAKSQVLLVVTGVPISVNEQLRRELACSYVESASYNADLTEGFQV